MMRARGFTLLELLVALSIFAFISAMAYSGLNTVLDSREQTDAQATRLAQLQKAFLFISRDFQQAADRPIRDGYGTQEPAFRSGLYGDPLVEFTRIGWSNPVGQKRSVLQRVAYGVKEEQLVRYHWYMLDRAPGDEPVATVLIDKAKSLELRYLDGQGQWQTQWPSPNQPANPQQPAVPLPKAVEFTVDVVGYGRITRLFLVPAGS